MEMIPSDSRKGSECSADSTNNNNSSDGEYVVSLRPCSGECVGSSITRCVRFRVFDKGRLILLLILTK